MLRRVSGSLRAADVAVGLLTENTPGMLAQATRLVRSIRWFGGELARARVVVCGVGVLEAGARSTLEGLGAEIGVVSRFHPANPTANRHQVIAELLDAPQKLLFVLDCDTLVVRDPLPYLSADVFQGKITPTPTVSDDVFERLFAHFGLPKPPRSYVTPFSGTPTIPYFNAGVLAIPTVLARKLATVWRKYNERLAEAPELVAPCQRHMHQASLSLALAETGIPVRELPAAMNFQINATHVTPPAGYAEMDPVIIHYHHLGTEDGFLLPCPYRGAQARIELFHDRMRAEGYVQNRFVQDGGLPTKRESRPIVVLGMHRSGTSIVAQLINALGVYAGQPDELTPPDMFNPTGYWELDEVVGIDADILAALSASWNDVVHADVSRLSEKQRAKFVARARRVVQSLQEHGSFLLKDPRMSLLFPLWQEALQEPICIIAWRDPFAVARSLATRDRRPLVPTLALWEHYNRTLLRDTASSPRLLVSYEEVLADPVRVTRRLYEQLTAHGVRGLNIPSEERIRQLVNADFNRSGGETANEDTLLNSEQCALLAGLRSGAILDAAVAPTSAGTVELLATVSSFEDTVRTVRREVDDRNQLLRAVFESRSWQIGHGLTTLLRFGRRHSISASERWREMKSEDNEGS